MDDLKSHRYDVADVLQDVCRILGGVQCLRQIIFILEQEVSLFAESACGVDQSVGTAREKAKQ